MRPDDSVTRFELVPYFHGKILDLSEGTSRAFPHFISYLGLTDDPAKLGLFADKSLDGILSSYLLHLMHPDSVRETLNEWVRVVKPNGHIMLHLPGEGKFWDVSFETVSELLPWDLAYFKNLDSGLLFVFRNSQTGNTWDRPKPEKTVGIVRLGAFGDLIQASTLFPWFKENGYAITLYCSDHGYPVVKHDPHVDRFIIQGRDEVPPQWLTDFWDHEAKKYNKWVNLSESVEGTLLAAPGSSKFQWPNEVRSKLMDRNYLEFTHELAEVPPPYRPKFYATPDERLWARRTAKEFGRRNILWSLSGSSVHKTWPHVDAVIARLMIETDYHVVLVGDEACQILEQGWGKEPRVHCKSGIWSIRESMAFAEVADLIVGTETGLLNAAGLMPTPKIVCLSHSSPEMLTKHWLHTTVLQQPKGIGCPKQPCRMLHHDWSACMKHEDPETDSVSAACQFYIRPDVMAEAILKVLRGN